MLAIAQSWRSGRSPLVFGVGSQRLIYELAAFDIIIVASQATIVKCFVA